MEPSKDFVTCISWVRKGIPKQQPIQVQYTKEELKEIIDSTRRNLSDNHQINNEIENLEVVNNDVEMQDDQNNLNNEEAEIIDRYGLDDYENFSDSEQQNIVGGFSNLVTHDSNENDPYLAPDDSEDEEEEAQDFNLNADDNLMLVGRVQEDASSLEIYVYNKDDNYIHHDVYLPAFPMCIETINYNSKEQTNCNWCAVGDMKGVISIWDLDIVNELEPLVSLKGHKDAVLDLSWNSKMTNIIASCSVDKTVRLWDLNINKSIHKLKKFNNRVQSIQFNSQDEGKLIVGDCDGKVLLVDCNALSMQTYLIPNNEIEKVIWFPDSVHNFVASTDNGTIHLYDARVKQEIKNVQAHEKSVTDLTFSINNLLLSACEDGEIKIWDLVSNNFKLIDTYKESNVGRIFAIATNPDYPLVVAVGGDRKRKSIEVLSLDQLDSVKSYLNLTDQ